MDKNTETLYTLMDNQLRRLDVPEEYRSLEKFIESDDTCVAFIQYILHDENLQNPSPVLIYINLQKLGPDIV